MKSGRKLQTVGITAALVFTATQTFSQQSLHSKTSADLWNGLYFGAYVGGGTGHSKSTYSATSSTLTINNATITRTLITNAAFSHLPEISTNGSIADLFVGYNYPVSNTKLLLGAQFEGTIFSDIATKSAGAVNTYTTTTNLITNTSVASNSYNTTSTRYNLSSILSVVARAGFLARPDTLVYGLVGPSDGNFVIPNSTESTLFNKNQWKLGVNAGVGVEHKFNNNWSLLAEYRYLYFNNINNYSNTNLTSTTVAVTTLLVTTSTASNQLSWNNNFSMNIGKIGVAFRC